MKRAPKTPRKTPAANATITREKVFVGVPALDWICVDLHRALMDMQVANFTVDSRFEFTFEIVNGATPIELARNELAEKFLKTDCDKLFFIDTDILPHNKILRLLWSGADIAGALAPVRQGATHYWNVFRRVDNKFVQDIARNGGTHEHEGVGFGAVVIKRRVFEKVGQPYFRTLRAPNGKTIVGEDLDFCDRARKAGCVIVADHQLRCGHIKESNLAEYLAYSAT